MKIKHQCTLGRLIGKIDNDFNISESDWVPRVAAWTIDALSQLRCLPMERKKRQLDVDNNRIALFPCELNAKEIRVWDSNGCEISYYEGKSSCCNSEFETTNVDSDSEIAVIDTTNKSGINFMKVVNVTNPSCKYFIIDCNQIILNFDTDKITVESYEVATYYDEYYDCQCPYIYDNGYLLEALSWYVLYKYLSRGSKHPVYSLTSPSQIINPFYQWTAIKDKAKTSIAKDLANDDSGWRNFFYNSTFDPRRS